MQLQGARHYAKQSVEKSSDNCLKTCRKSLTTKSPVRISDIDEKALQTFSTMHAILDYKEETAPASRSEKTGRVTG